MQGSADLLVGPSQRQVRKHLALARRKPEQIRFARNRGSFLLARIGGAVVFRLGEQRRHVDPARRDVIDGIEHIWGGLVLGDEPMEAGGQARKNALARVGTRYDREPRL